MSKWWKNLNDIWSEDKVTFLTSGDKINANNPEYWMGDVIFHRFFGTNELDDGAISQVVLVEAQNWDKWTQWLETHTTGKSLFPLYVIPLDQAIMSHRSFRIVKWVDEYPLDLFHNNSE